MKAILCTRPGGPDDLELAELADPEAGPGEAVVAVRSAALNFFDTLIIAGRYQVKPSFPFSPAGEIAGVVEAVGPGVEGLAPGDRVQGHIGYGGAREKIVVSASRLVKLPQKVDFDHAAGLVITYGTTLHAFRDRAVLKSGETLAVLGASGGVGQAAIELGKIMGARVIACASSDEKLAFAKEHGADETINYGKDDLKEKLRELTGGRGPDVIYDPVGSDYTEPALRAIAWRGRFLVLGFAAGEIPKLPLNLVLLKGCDVMGIHWGAFMKHEPDRARANTVQLLQWCAEGKLSPHIHAVYPLAETPAALKAISARTVMGKVIIRP